ncbi:MAG: hypothetical protein KBD15_04105 [Candidatus Magasanikbacteria bacterium]|nr:hypothetical protein [Candidatus Magasanikbacteria bacterium]
MHAPLYRQALVHGWHVATTHKSLWIFGLFAALLGQMGVLDIVVHTVLAKQQFPWYPLVFDVRELWSVLQTGLSSWVADTSSLVWVLWLGLFFIAIKCGALFLGVLSQGVLIGSQSDVGKSVRKKNLHIGRAWHRAIDHVWPLFFLYIIKRTIILLVTALVGFALYSVIQEGTLAQEIVFISLFLLSVAVGLFISFFVMYAAGYVVQEKYSFIKSCEASWNMCKAHWVVSLEVGILLLLVNVLAALFGVIGVIFFAAQIAAIWAGGLVLGSVVFQQIGFWFTTFLFILYIVFLGSFLSVYTTSVWMFVFQKMHTKGIVSRVLHFFGHRP